MFWERTLEKGQNGQPKTLKTTKQKENKTKMKASWVWKGDVVEQKTAKIDYWKGCEKKKNRCRRIFKEGFLKSRIEICKWAANKDSEGWCASPCLDCSDCSPYTGVARSKPCDGLKRALLLERYTLAEWLAISLRNENCPAHRVAHGCSSVVFIRAMLVYLVVVIFHSSAVSGFAVSSSSSRNAIRRACDDLLAGVLVQLQRYDWHIARNHGLIGGLAGGAIASK